MSLEKIITAVDASLQHRCQSLVEFVHDRYSREDVEHNAEGLGLLGLGGLAYGATASVAPQTFPWDALPWLSAATAYTSAGIALNMWQMPRFPFLLIGSLGLLGALYSPMMVIAWAATFGGLGFGAYVKACKEPEKTFYPSYFRRAAMTTHAKDALGLATFLESFQDPAMVPVNLKPFVKKNHALSDEELGKYRLIYDISRHHAGIHFGQKYFDAPFNVCLTYEKELIASLGFSARSGELFIEQLQGVQLCRELLSPIKWERALVGTVLHWAQQYGVSHVTIVSADNNPWVQDHHLEYRQAQMLYNVTAQRCGFRKTKKGNYTKIIHG